MLGRPYRRGQPHASGGGVLRAGLPVRAADQAAEAEHQHDVAEDQRGLEHRPHDVAGPRLDEVAAYPEVDDQRCEDEKMFAEAHTSSVHELGPRRRVTVDDGTEDGSTQTGSAQTAGSDSFGAALDALSLAE